MLSAKAIFGRVDERATSHANKLRGDGESESACGSLRIVFGESEVKSIRLEL